MATSTLTIVGRCHWRTTCRRKILRTGDVECECRQALLWGWVGPQPQIQLITARFGHPRLLPTRLTVTFSAYCTVILLIVPSTHTSPSAHPLPLSSSLSFPFVIGPQPDPSSRCDVSRSPHNITTFCKALSPFALPNTSRSVASSFIIIFPLVSPHHQPVVSQPTSHKLYHSPAAASAIAHRCAHHWICRKEGIEVRHVVPFPLFFICDRSISFTFYLLS